MWTCINCERDIVPEIGVEFFVLPDASVVCLGCMAGSFLCSCGLVRYYRQPEGGFAGLHLRGQRLNSAGNAASQTFGLFMLHQDLHQRLKKTLREGF